MIVARYVRKFAAILSAAALFLATAADACTGIRLTAVDGTVVHARTLNATIGTPQHQLSYRLAPAGHASPARASDAAVLLSGTPLTAAPLSPPLGGPKAPLG